MNATPIVSTVFDVVAMAPDGRLTSRRLQAPSADHARRALEASGLRVMRCEPAHASQGWTTRITATLQPRPVAVDAVSFSQDMATLLEAGVTVSEAIHALVQREHQPRRLQTLRQVDAAIAEGLRLSAALERTGAFPALLVATVAASEHTGDLATGLSRYARHLQSLRTVRDRLISACVYPALLLVVGLVIVLALLGVVVPRFAVLIEASNKSLPLLSQLLMDWGVFVNAHPVVPWTALALGAPLLAGGLVHVSRPGRLKRLLERLPGVAKVARTFQHLQMYRTTAILTSRGIAVHKALVYSVELLGPGDRQRLQTALRGMGEGISMSRALFDSGLCDAVAMSMLHVAERSGSLPQVMDRLADFYERELQRKLDIVSRLVEPVLMVLLGIVIGGIVLLMYLPIFDLASSIG